jgi:hypothetical protein
MTKWYYSFWNKYLLNGHLINYDNLGYLIHDKATSIWLIILLTY